MTPNLHSVDGQRIRWARTELKMSMKDVQELGGPSQGFQSEVELGRKRQVSGTLLTRWVSILQVTMPFARGELVTYVADAAACTGLAADVGQWIQSGEYRRLMVLDPVSRSRDVLNLIATRSERLPRVVLSYVLGVSVGLLDSMTKGQAPISTELQGALVKIADLPEHFLVHDGPVTRPPFRRRVSSHIPDKVGQFD